MLTVDVRMIAAALTGALASGAASAQPPRSWLDEQEPPRWNKPGVLNEPDGPIVVPTHARTEPVASEQPR